jgi:plasmid stability protein
MWGTLQYPLGWAGFNMDPKWIHNESMAKTVKTVTLSVKNVPADLAKRLKERAARNNRSLQGELLEILDQAGHSMTLDDLADLARRLGIKSDKNESTQWIREDRDDPRR